MGMALPPNDLELTSLSMFVVKHFQDFALAEITDAFEYAAAEKLDLDYTEVKTYNSFSDVYVGKILSAYRRYRTKTVKDFPVMVEEKKKEISKEESLKIARKDARLRLIQEYKRFFETGEYKLIDGQNIAYDYLDSLGLIKFDSKRKNEFMSIARSVLGEQDLKRDPLKFKTIANAIKALEGDSVVKEAKRIALKVWIKEQAEELTDIEQLLKDAEK